MEISWEQLQPATLQAVIEEYVSRDGTDYGEQEIDHVVKTAQVHQLLRENKIRLVFDLELGSCNFISTELKG